MQHAIDWHQVLLRLLDRRPTKSPFCFKQIHALFLTTGLALHSYPFSRLLSLSSLPHLFSSLDGNHSCYSYSLLLCSPRPPSAFLINTLTSSLASSGHHHLALSLYSLLSINPTIRNYPNPHTYPSLLKACSTSSHLLPLGLALHARLIKLLFIPLDPFVVTSLLILHSRRDRIDACRSLFDQIPCPDLPAWNAVLSCYARRSDDSFFAAAEVLFLFQELQLSPSPAIPNEISLVALVGACGELATLSLGTWAHAYIQRRKSLVVNRFVGASLIDMYSKCGCLNLAFQVFDNLLHTEKDTFCYNAMMRGLATHGHGHGVLSLFEGMRREGIQPDDVTLLLVMSGCSHSGLLEEGRRCFERMAGEFGILPKLEHYGCLVDILGRAGRLEEAHEVLRKMPVKPNAVLFRSLLAACRVYRSLHFGETSIVKLMQLKPLYAGNYVLLSNIYADVGRWDDAVRVRKAMKERDIDKSPGLSLVEIDGTFHEFSTGHHTHPQAKEIYAMLDRISRRFHECGPIPLK
ncbi:Pentatricopeptide repeat-containing protein [Platanthera guangdongensis]|uniref:Pentatricopeptide repeat-containing protein n=1 Tax=Platanthera guangdongensis TaxID=2320717 RepID=A0ABR2MFL6_9ASPA